MSLQNGPFRIAKQPVLQSGTGRLAFPFGLFGQALRPGLCVGGLQASLPQGSGHYALAFVCWADPIRNKRGGTPLQWCSASLWQWGVAPLHVSV